MAQKKFSWLKMPKGFHKSKLMRYLGRQSNGLELTYIYEELLGIALENGGFLYYDDIEDSFAEELYYTIDSRLVTVEGVESLLTILEDKSLITETEEGAYYLEEFPNYVGSESDSAERVRKHRGKNKISAVSKSVTPVSCNGNEISCNAQNVTDVTVTTCNENVTVIRERERIREEKEKSKRKKKNEEEEDILALAQTVISLLNDLSGSSYQYDSATTLKYFRARYNQGFKDPEDYYKVVRYKVKEWGKNEEFSKYLRPSTLFGTKFEDYIQQAGRANRSSVSDIEFVNPAFGEDFFDDVPVSAWKS